MSANYCNLCGLNPDGGYVYEDNEFELFGIRPIVILTYDIEVEQNGSGQWDIAY